jgi:hypothetical protein
MGKLPKSSGQKRIDKCVSEPNINLILRIRKLERLAANNPNPHEAEAAKRKAARLRAQLPANAEREFDRRQTAAQAPMPMPNVGSKVWARSWKQQHRSPTESKWDALIKELQHVMPRLKQSGQLFAADLAAQYHTRGTLSQKQWACVNQLIEEAD